MSHPHFLVSQKVTDTVPTSLTPGPPARSFGALETGSRGVICSSLSEPLSHRKYKVLLQQALYFHFLVHRLLVMFFIYFFIFFKPSMQNHGGSGTQNMRASYMQPSLQISPNIKRKPGSEPRGSTFFSVYHQSVVCQSKKYIYIHISHCIKIQIRLLTL